MTATRSNTIILDTSVLPKRPKVSDVKKFVDSKLKLDMTTVKRIQLHNIKNIVRVGMTTLEAAEQAANNNHLKHYMEFDGTQITVPVPIYVESDAVDVRAFDLPEDISNDTLKTFFSKYGEVISIRDEVWKNFFPGLENGVKVLKMRLAVPIPSIVTVEDEPTLIEYKNQPKTAKRKTTSNKPVAEKPPEHIATSAKATDQRQPNTQNEQQWPALNAEANSTNSKKSNNNNKEETTNKRQRSESDDNDSQKNTSTEGQKQENNDSNSEAFKLNRIIERLESIDYYGHIADRKHRAKCILKRARELLRYEP